MQRLAAHADVVIENYGPGTMERLGCGYEALAKANPRLVYLALKGYLAGPYEHRPALDEVVQFQVGLAYMTGPPGQPLRAGASIVDILGAVFGVVAAQAALRERETTGKGQRVSSALFESAAFLMATHMAGMAVTGAPMPPMPARRGAWAIYEVFKLADGELFIGVTSDQQWTRFVEEFGLQSVAADPRLATNVMRNKERAWLIPILQAAAGRGGAALRTRQRLLGPRRTARRPIRGRAPAREQGPARRLHFPGRRRRRPQGRTARAAHRVRRPAASWAYATAPENGRAQRASSCRGGLFTCRNCRAGRDTRDRGRGLKATPSCWRRAMSATARSIQHQQPRTVTCGETDAIPIHALPDQ
jgi:hypothetical protein